VFFPMGRLGRQKGTLDECFTSTAGWLPNKSLERTRER
jgi:hypothetical protein